MRSKYVATLIAVLFGQLGFHQLYLRRYPIWIAWVFAFGYLVSRETGNAAAILFFMLTGWVQGISYLFYSQEKWDTTFN